MLRRLLTEHAPDDARQQLAERAIEAREAEVRAGVRAAIAALRRDPGADWMQRHRRWHPIAVKARLVRLVGRKVLRRSFPTMTSTNRKTPVEQAFALLDAMDAEGCERVRLRLGELEHARLVREVEHQKELDKLAIDVR